MPYPYGCLRVRRSVPFVCKLTHADWSCANHNRVPPLFYSARFSSDCLCSKFYLNYSPFFLSRQLVRGRLPHGKESSLFIPSFLLFFLLPYPYGSCRLLATLTIRSLVFPLIFTNMKDLNIFCSFLSFCTFIITDYFYLSRGFWKFFFIFLKFFYSKAYNHLF